MSVLLFALLSCRLPFLSHIASYVHILIRRGLIPLEGSKLCETGHTHDSLNRKVGIMSPVSGEVVGAKLVFGILTILHKVIGPGLKDIPIGECIVCVSVEHTNLRNESKHISCFLKRHVAAIYLTVGSGILTEVVSGERLGPSARLAVVEDRSHHPFLELRVIAKEERSFGISEVNSVDTSVGVVLLREEEEVAVFILEELVGGNHMSVAAGKELCIFLPPYGICIIIDHLVKLAATLHDRSI